MAKYSAEFKLEVVKYYLEKNCGYVNTANHFGNISDVAVPKWVRKYKEHGEKGIRQSMSRKGNCLDNSLAENFFGLLKSELFYMKEYKTIEELEKDIIEYIDYYNNKRIKSKLKGMSPVQYRIHSHAA